MLLIIKPSHSCCRPRVVFTIDEHHGKVVLPQESIDTFVKISVKLDVGERVGNHHTTHVSLGMRYREVFFEGSRIVTIISKLTHSLHIERGVRSLLRKIARLALVNQMLVVGTVGSCESRNLCHIITPLPKRKGVLKHSQVKDFADRHTEGIAFA